MPTETWGNSLYQAQLALRELATRGATARTPDELLTLADHVGRTHSDEYFRITALGRPPRLVRWEEPELREEEEDEDQVA